MSDSVQIKLVEGMHFEGFTPASDTVVHIDSDPSSGGQGMGHRPLTLMLLGLLGCMALDVASIMRKKKQEFTEFEAKIVNQERAPDHPKVYTKIHLHFSLAGPKVEEQALARSIELSKTKYCSASAMLAKTADIEITYEVHTTEPVLGS